MVSAAPRPNSEPIEAAPQQVAHEAGLRYSGDVEPGIRRKRSGKSFRYVDAQGKAVKDAATLDRIDKLVIPPAWTDVWICADPDGHLQATGRDARRRKQYRYHPRWREVRDETKYHRMLAFARALPAIRVRVDQDMARRGLPREKVLAAVVKVLETTLMRVGNEEYARDNESFGAATLRDEHVDVSGGTMTFAFKGKSGKRHEITLKDRRLAKIVKSCQDLPGQELFQYLDDDGIQRDVASQDINDYLREIAGDQFTAKDFRTWAGTVLAAMALREFESFETRKALKTNVKRAIEQVAAKLGNTPAVCRKCYVHPEILESYADGALLDFLRQKSEIELSELEGLQPEEAVVLAFLQQRLARPAGKPTARKAARTPGRS